MKQTCPFFLHEQSHQWVIKLVFEKIDVFNQYMKLVCRLNWNVETLVKESFIFKAHIEVKAYLPIKPRTSKFFTVVPLNNSQPESQCDENFNLLQMIMIYNKSNISVLWLSDYYALTCLAELCWVEGWISKAKGLWEWLLKVSRPLDYFRIEDKNFAGFQHF